MQEQSTIFAVLKATSGDVFVVNDDEIMEVLKELYGKGIIVEPTSATAYAAFKKVRGINNALIPMTGTGIKTIDKLNKIFM